jgi:hypothetical protein
MEEKHSIRESLHYLNKRECLDEESLNESLIAAGLLSALGVISLFSYGRVILSDEMQELRHLGKSFLNKYKRDTLSIFKRYSKCR